MIANQTQTRLKDRLDILREAGHASPQYLHGFSDGFHGLIAPGSHGHGFWRGVAAGERFRTEIAREAASL